MSKAICSLCHGYIGEPEKHGQGKCTDWIPETPPTTPEEPKQYQSLEIRLNEDIRFIEVQSGKVILNIGCKSAKADLIKAIVEMVGEDLTDAALKKLYHLSTLNVLMQNIKE